MREWLRFGAKSATPSFSGDGFGVTFPISFRDNRSRDKTGRDKTGQYLKID